MMYYTDNADNGTEFQSCGYLCNEEQNRAYPADSIRPLPPNPLLEAYAIHGKMNHQLRTNSTAIGSELEEKPSVTDERPIHHQEEEESKSQQAQEVLPSNNNSASQLIDDDVHQHFETTSTVTEVASSTVAAITKESMSISKETHRDKAINQISMSKLDSQKREDNFWSFLFFFRRFFS
jgi:peptidylamidoglycolate lyase